MSSNGDRLTPTDSLAPFSNWREQDLTDIPTPEALKYVQCALVELDKGFRAWRGTEESRIKMAIELAAEESSSKVERKILRELGTMANRVKSLEEADATIKGSVDKASRDSQNALEEAAAAAKKLAHQTHVHIHPEKVASDGPPSMPMVPKKWARKHKIAAWAAFFVTLVVTTVMSVLASRGH